MNTVRSPFSLWLRWFIAVFVSQTAANFINPSMLSMTMPDLMAALNLPDYVVWAACSAFGGALLGVAQWVVLRKELQHAGGWILTTTLGNTLTVVISQLAAPPAFWHVVGLYAFWLLISVPLHGLLLGLGQWWVLRGQVARAGWWIPIQVFSLVASTLAGLYTNISVAPITTLPPPVLLFIFGLTTASFYGALTGAGLVFVLAKPKPALPSSATNLVSSAP